MHGDVMRGEADNGMAKKVVITIVVVVVEVNSFAGTVLYWVLCMEESHIHNCLMKV